MFSVFLGVKNFNGSLKGWDIFNVIIMKEMFFNVKLFN